MFFAFLVWNRVWLQIHGYRFSGSGLERGLKNHIFWSEIGSGFWEPCGTGLTQTFGEYPSPTPSHPAGPGVSFNCKYISIPPCAYKRLITNYFIYSIQVTVYHRVFFAFAVNKSCKNKWSYLWLFHNYCMWVGSNDNNFLKNARTRLGQRPHWESYAPVAWQLSTGKSKK